MAGMGLLEQREFKAGIKAARKAAREEVWEYVRGSDRVRLSARFEPRHDDGGRPARVTAYVAPGIDAGAMRLEGYDIVQGVFFFRLSAPETGLGADPDGPLMLQAYLGDGVAIGVHAERPVEGLETLLDAIDYDGLNAMLDEPTALVGSNAPQVPENQKAQFLQVAAAAYMDDPALWDAAAGHATGTSPAFAAEPRRPKGGQALRQTREAEGVPRLVPGTSGDNGPKRLELSGGRSCLGNFASTFCD